MLWICTLGNLHFWLLPNLTAECGFFESFVPAYEYTVIKSEEKEEGKIIKKKKEKSGSEKEKSGSEKEKSGSEKEKSGSEKEKSGSEKEKSGSDAHNDKDDDDDQLESDHSDPNVNVPNIVFNNKSKLESIDNEDIELDDKIEHPRIEELVDNVKHEMASENTNNIKAGLSAEVTSNKNDEPPEDISQKQDVIEGITDDLTFIDKLENESEESNGSTKEDGWVKVKKDEVNKDLPKNENEVNC